MLKVAIVAGNSFDSLGWHINFTFNQLGFRSKVFDLYTVLPLSSKLTHYTNKFSISCERLMSNLLQKKLFAYNPDLIIVAYRTVPPDLVSNCKKKLNCKIIFWTGDTFLSFDRGYPFISEFDAWFLKDRFMCELVRDKICKQVYYLPECFNPDVHVPSSNSQFGSNSCISIMGTLYPYRAKIIENLVDDFEVKLYGSLPRWMDKKWKKHHTGKYIKGEEKATVFYTSAINLNTLFYGEINSSNCRLFEVAGSGGFQICDEREEIKDLFKENEEIVLFKDIDELKDKIKFYLKSRDKAFEIASKARKRAIQEHTYEHRVKTVLQVLGLD